MNGSMEEPQYTAADGEKIGEASSSDHNSMTPHESLVHSLAARWIGPVTSHASAVVGNVQARIVPVASSVLEQWKEDRWQELRHYEEKGGSKGSLVLTLALCFIIVFHLDLIRLYRHLFQKGGIVERSSFHLRFRYQQWKYRKRSSQRSSSSTGGLLSRISMAASRRGTHKASNTSSTENDVLLAKLGSPTSTASTMEAKSSVTHNNNPRSPAPPPNSRGKMMLLMQQQYAPLSPNVSKKKTLGGSFNSNTSSSQVGASSGTIRRASNNNFTELTKTPNIMSSTRIHKSDRSHHRHHHHHDNSSHNSTSTAQTSRSRASTRSRRSVQWSLKHGSVGGSITSYKSKTKNRVNSLGNNSSSRKSSSIASSPVSLTNHQQQRRRPSGGSNNNRPIINTHKYKLGSSPATNLLDSSASSNTNNIENVDLDTNLLQDMMMTKPPPPQEQHPDSQSEAKVGPPPPPPPPPPPSNSGAASSDDDGGFKTPLTGNSPCSTPSNAAGKRIVDVNRVQDMTNRMKQKRSRGQNTSVSPHSAAGFRRSATVDSAQLQLSQHSGSNKSSFSSTASQSHTSNANTSTNTPTRTPRGKKNAQANTTRLGDTRRRLSTQHANTGAHAYIAHPSLEASSSQANNSTNNANELRRSQTAATPTRYQRRKSGTGLTPGIPAPSPFGRARSGHGGLVARSRSGNPAVASTMTASQMYMQRHQSHGGGPVGPSSTSGGSSNTKGRNSRMGKSPRSMDRSMSPPPPRTTTTHRSGPPAGGRRITRELSRDELGYE